MAASVESSQNPTTSTAGSGSSKRERKDPGTHTKTTLFIRGLPATCTSGDLESFFSEWGPIRSAFPVHRKDQPVAGGEEYKGIGFVHFALAEDAQRALEGVKEGIKFMDRIIVGELALRKHSSLKAEVKSNNKRKVTKIVDDNGTSPVPPPAKVAKVSASPVMIIEIVPKEGVKAVKFDKKQLYKKLRKAGALSEMIYPFTVENEDEPKAAASEQKAKLIFGSAKEAEKAYAKINEHTFKGHLIRVVPTGSNDAMNIKQHRLIIRNLAFSVKQEQLQAALAPLGEIKEISVPRKGTVGRGFAFVQFKERETAVTAMQQLNGRELLGRIVAIDFAVNKSIFERIQSEESHDKEMGQDENQIVDIEGDSDRDVEKGEEEEEEVEIDIENASDVEDDDESKVSNKNEATLNATIFIRNVPFSTEEDELAAVLASFGKLEYCKIVRDGETGAAKGTAFAKFLSARSAQAAVAASQAITQRDLDLKERASEGTQQQPETTLDASLGKINAKLEGLAKKRTGKSFKSVLDAANSSLVDADADTSGMKGIVVDGRALSIVPAVDRKQARELKKDGEYLDSGPQDRRNLYLINETLLKPKTKGAKKFWPSLDIGHRERVAKERRKELKSNPNIFISTTRLSLRHLPLAAGETEIRRVLYAAVQRALSLGEQDEGFPLLDAKLLAAAPYRTHLKQVKIVKDSERNRSKGYAFAEFSAAPHALLAVRYLANYEPGLWRELGGEAFSAGARHKSADPVFRAKAPVVEFATEKKSVIEKREQRLRQTTSNSAAKNNK